MSGTFTFKWSVTISFGRRSWNVQHAQEAGEAPAAELEPENAMAAPGDCSNGVVLEAVRRRNSYVA